MIKVITFGVFDLLHIGHINLFRRAKYEGDILIVAVQNDVAAKLNKPNTQIIDDCFKRMTNVSHVDYVSRVIEYSQIDDEIKNVDFDVLVVGEDQKNEHFYRAIKWCEDNNKRVVYLSRTKGVSSTILRENR